MQHPPVIKDQHPPRRKLLPVLTLLLLEDLGEQARGVVPGGCLVDGELDARAVGRVPADAQQVARGRVVLEDGEAAVRLDADAVVARGVRVDVDGRERVVGARVAALELLGRLEAVHEERGAPRAVRVGQEVERLQPGWV